LCRGCCGQCLVVVVGCCGCIGFVISCSCVVIVAVVASHSCGWFSHLCCHFHLVACGWLLQLFIIPHGCIIVYHGCIMVVAIVASCHCGWLLQLPPLSWLLLWLLGLVLVVAVDDCCCCSCFCPYFPLFHGCFPHPCSCVQFGSLATCFQSHWFCHGCCCFYFASEFLQPFAAMDSCSSVICIIIFQDDLNNKFDH